MMPAVPTTDLIVGPSGFAFGFAQAVFDDGALRMNSGPFATRSFRRGVGETVVEIALALNWFRGQDRHFYDRVVIRSYGTAAEHTVVPALSVPMKI